MTNGDVYKNIIKWKSLRKAPYAMLCEASRFSIAIAAGLRYAK